MKAKDRIDTNLETWDRRRDVRNGREKEEAERLQEVLNMKTLSNEKDKWQIKGAPNGEYATEWFRECLECHKTMGQTQQDFWNK